MAATNAIMTVDQYLERSGDKLDEQSADRIQIGLLINSVSDHLENYLQRAIVAPAAAVTEYIFGHAGPDYYCKNGRINALTSLKYQDTVDANDGTITWTLMSAGDYPRSITAESGKFEFVNGHVFTAGQRYEFIYTTGWEVGSVPDPIVLVGVMLIKRLLKSLDDKEGVTSKSIGDQTTSYDLAKLMTARHRDMLRKYKVVG